MRSIGQSAVKLKGLPMLGIWIVITIAGVYLAFAATLNVSILILNPRVQPPTSNSPDSHCGDSPNRETPAAL